MNTNRIRTRWAAIGAAVAVTLGAGSIGITHATTTSGERPIYLPIEPCRLADTRPASNVGPRATPLGAAETYDIAGWGAVGNCTLPSNTAGLALNVTAIDPDAPTFLTLFPDGTTLPLASHLNPTPGQPPTPNAVNVDLSAAGNFSIYNLAGNVHVAIDVVGIYDDHNHDDRYYTEAEVDAAVAAAKSVVASANNNGSINVANGVAPQSAVSVSLVAPAAGTVVVNANAYAGDTGAGGVGVRCSINDTVAIDFSYLLYALGEFSGQTRPFSGTRAFDVTAGQSFTAHLACDANSGTGYVQDRSMTAIFVPD